MKTLYAFLAFLAFLFSILIHAFLSVSAVYLVVPTAEAQTTPIMQNPAKESPSTTSIQTYVETEAKAQGVNPADALWIVSHESEYDPTRLGDEGKSRGLWQIDKDFHPEVSDSCAFDVQCSTEWSLSWILAGNINEWSTWKYRFLWYANQNPPL